MRSLLLVVASVCVLLGLSTSIVRWQMRRAREHQVVVELCKHGATYGKETGLIASAGERPGWFHARFFNYVAAIDLSQHTWWLAELRDSGKAPPPVPDSALAALSQLRALRKLDLRDSPFTDKSVSHLKRLQRLEELDIRGTQISEAGYRELREALSECVIQR